MRDEIIRRLGIGNSLLEEIERFALATDNHVALPTCTNVDVGVIENSRCRTYDLTLVQTRPVDVPRESPS